MTNHAENARLAPALGWDEQGDRSACPVVGVLEGEGVGPEVVPAALDVLEAVSAKFDQKFEVRHGGPIGLESARQTGMWLTPKVISFCQSIFAEGGAVLCGPGGGRFVYELRTRFDLFCKFTPLRPVPALADVGVLRPEVVRDVDVLMVRENVGGLYFGEDVVRYDTMGTASVEHRFRYGREEVERILTVALNVARRRRGRLTLVVKPGGLELMSQLWVETLERLAPPTGVLTTVLGVDNAAYQLVTAPQAFDVIVSPNMVGDVLADCGGVLVASRGMTSSGNFGPHGAVFQTGHGAAYDLAGLDRANPLGQIGALVMMLRESFGLYAAAAVVEAAVAETVAAGSRTADIAGPTRLAVGTRELARQVAESVERQPAGAIVAA